MPKLNLSAATTVRVVAKCSDLCFVKLMDKDGNAIAQYDGYVPDFMPGEHYGDYIELDIDLKTGVILNWKRPSAKALSKPTKQQNWERP